MNNIAIFYYGGNGGFFIYYYLLASDSDIFSHIGHDLKIGKSKKLLDTMFYKQFKKLENINDWKQNEIYPNFKDIANNDDRQLFLYCNNFKNNLGPDTKVINPYIPDKKKWLRMQYEKRCKNFRRFPKSTYRQLFNYYKDLYYDNAQSKVPDADYCFDFLKFVSIKSERKKLCDFLEIDINSRMEEYLTHYVSCQQNLLTKLLRC